MNLRTPRRGTVIGAIAGAVFAAVGGAAIAAIMLNTTVTGSTSYADASASMEVTSVSVGEQKGGVTCAATKLGGNAVKVDPKVKRITGGGDNATVPGSCVITMNLKNTGSEPLTLAAFKFDGAAPAGWTLVDPKGSTKLAAGATGTVSATVTANDKAGQGSFKAIMGWTTDTYVPHA